MAEQYSRHLNFESVTNFRDLGGYKTRGGRTVAWRRLFRSGEFNKITRIELDRLTREIGPASIIDLRSDQERERRGTGLLTESGIRFHNISLMTDDDDRKGDEDFSSMGEFYNYLVGKREFGQRIVEALEIITQSKNHPLVFHCAIGKDRTGILAAIVLGVLGVADEDIIEDYTLSGPYIVELINDKENNPEINAMVKVIPDFFWEATHESMATLLATITRDYGSVRGYLEAHGAGYSLTDRLENALLV